MRRSPRKPPPSEWCPLHPKTLGVAKPMPNGVGAVPRRCLRAPRTSDRHRQAPPLCFFGRETRGKRRVPNVEGHGHKLGPLGRANSTPSSLVGGESKPHLFWSKSRCLSSLPRCVGTPPDAARPRCRGEQVRTSSTEDWRLEGFDAWREEETSRTQ